MTAVPVNWYLILGTVLFTSLASSTRDRLTEQGLPSQATDAIVSAMDGSAGQALPAIRLDPRGAAVVPAIETSFADAARSAGFVAFAFIVLGFFLSLWIPAQRPMREHVAAEGPTRTVESA